MTPAELAAKLREKLRSPQVQVPLAPKFKPTPRLSPQALARTLRQRGGRSEERISDQRSVRQNLVPPPVPRSKKLEPYIAFASGLKPGQMYGFAEIGRGIGFSLAEKREGASLDVGSRAWRGYVDILHRLSEELPGGFSVLVDNGAVQEVDTETMVAVAPISDASWRKRMDRYIELAALLGDAAWLITPDRIGDQQESHRRFALCAPQLRQAAADGAVLVLTLQPGPLGPVELEHELRALLGPGVKDKQIVPAFPMRPRRDDRRLTVTPLPSLLDFVQRRRPRVVHLLGMGLKSKLLPEVLEQISRVSPETKVTLDSADIRSVAAQGRPWIEEKPWAQEQVRRRRPYEQGGVFDIDDTEVLAGDLDREQLLRAALEVGVDRACAERFADDPLGVYGILKGWDEGESDDPCWGEGAYPDFDMALSHERFLQQAKFPRSAGASERDRLLVHRVFRGRKG